MNHRGFLLLGLAAVAPIVGPTVAGRAASAAEPQRLAVAQDKSGVTVEADGKPFATYVIDQANKPYLWPIIGPTGKPMTRAFPMRDLPEEPAAQRDHPHHRGITFGHESVGGAGWKFPDSWDGRTGAEPHRGGGDTWHERLTFPVADGQGNGQGEPTDKNRARLATLGRIVHREFTRVTVDGDRAVIEEVCDHVDPAGRPFLVEQRRLTFRATGDTRTIDIDQEFACAAASGAVRFDDRKDAGLFIRVPTTMAVDSKQGGRIVNSEGLVDSEAWSKPARWCHYHGPVAGEQLGIAILNHPASFRHPTRWHVRTYGLFAANPFASRQYDPALPDGTTTLVPGAVLRLHHRFFFHTIDEKGDAGTGAVEAAWKAYAAESPQPFASAAGPATIVVGAGGPGWRDLTADDFETVNGEPGTWTWQGNSVRCTGQPVGVIRTKQTVTNLELSLEWRHLTGGGNSGVFLWAPPAALEKLPPGKLPPGGIEVQVLDHGYTAQYEKSAGKKADWFTTDGDVFPVGTSSMQPFPPVAPDGKRSFPTARHTRGTPEWNHYYIRAIDGEVRLWVNGHEVSGGSRCTPATGFLCLESEGAPVEFRRLRIRELPARAAAAPAAAETIRLWPGDAPGALGTADHDIPVVAWWPARDARQPTAAVVVCPGGGYGGLADHEGSDYARWLNAEGISAFVLRYRLGSKGYRHPAMLGDVSRAMRLVRAEHARLGIDPARVGVMGSSAGGHLAITLLTHGDDGDPAATDAVDRQPSRPALGVLCYPVVSMLPTNAHAGSRRNLLGESPPDELVRELSGELAVSDKTPPVFLWHTVEDKSVKLAGVLDLAAALDRHGRPFELHVYEKGPHGIGLGVRPYEPARLHPWTAECRRWLAEQGFTAAK